LLQVRDSRAVRLLVDLGVDLDALAERADALGTATEGLEARPPARLRLAALIEQLTQERDDLKRALQRYGRHDEGCDPDAGCSCGLGPLLNG